MMKIETVDKVGTTSSLLCAIHCAVMPFIITILPIIGMGWLATQPVEWVLFFITLFIGISSIRMGLKKHNQKLPLFVIVLGILLLFSGRMLELKNTSATLFLVIGGSCVACGHLINRKLCQTCHKCQHNPL